MSLLEEKKIQISGSTCTIFLSSDTFYGAHDLALVGGELAQQGGSGLGWARLAAPPILSHGPTIGWAWSRGRRWAWETRPVGLEGAPRPPPCAPLPQSRRFRSSFSPIWNISSPLLLGQLIPAHKIHYLKSRLPSLCIFCFRKIPCIEGQKYVVGLFVI